MGKMTSSPDKIKRLRSLSKLLDSSIPLPGGYSIGLDGFLGMIPGIGDLAGGAASSYIVIESARFGASTGTLLRMMFNILLEMLIGNIPLFGDLFDFIWKANEKNIALLEKHFEKHPHQTASRNNLKIAALIILSLLVVGVIALALLGFMFFLLLINLLQGADGSF